MSYYTNYAINDPDLIRIGSSCFSLIANMSNDKFNAVQEIYLYIPKKHRYSPETITDDTTISEWISYLNELGLSCSVVSHNVDMKKLSKFSSSIGMSCNGPREHWIESGEYYIVKHVCDGKKNRTMVALTMMRMLYEEQLPRVINEWMSNVRAHPEEDKTELLYYSYIRLILCDETIYINSGHFIFMSLFGYVILFPMKTEYVAKKIKLFSDGVNETFMCYSKSGHYCTYHNGAGSILKEEKVKQAHKKINTFKKYIDYANEAKKNIPSGGFTVEQLCELAGRFV